ncbi:hypothetical protein D0863_10886 [Hortaea werneckii]|uniref:2-dehydropantoate 2-reductase n=1 Tax=Hortaea werneckii TaxID=91943 RepID=A0A3M7DF96_HORWE|nr:hypothetical protein D0863_10886 [Hortaea werneckii]
MLRLQVDRGVTFLQQQQQQQRWTRGYAWWAAGQDQGQDQDPSKTEGPRQQQRPGLESLMEASARQSRQEQKEVNGTMEKEQDPVFESGSGDVYDTDYSAAVAPAQLPRRIHMLGTGSIGKLVAHSLRGIPNPPPVSLIFHRYRLLEAWEQGKKVITIEDSGHQEQRGGFDVELLPQVKKQHGIVIEDGEEDVYEAAERLGVRPEEAADLIRRDREERQQDEEATDGQADSGGIGQQDQSDQLATPSRRRRYRGDYAKRNEPIHNLIVTTKAPLTVSALLPLRHRLGPQSTICFLQNGMGVVDEVNKQLFPKEEDRPNYVQGIITHGVNVPPAVAERDPFYAVHAGHGTIALGLLPRAENQSKDHAPNPEQDGTAGATSPSTPTSPPSRHRQVQPEAWNTARYLLRTLTRTPVLAAVGFPPTELLQQQLEKLAVNSILNLLTALIDSRNGDILHNFALTRTMRLMLAETSLVIRSLPELHALPNVNVRFSASRLETLVVSVAHQTRDNVSSMLADVRGGRRTEIEFINGYIVRRGEEMGIKCVVNYAMMQAVLGKSLITQREFGDDVPVKVDLNG